MYRQLDAEQPLVFKCKQSGMIALLGITFVIHIKLERVIRYKSGDKKTVRSRVEDSAVDY